MASLFENSALRAKLADWRMLRPGRSGDRRNRSADTPLLPVALHGPGDPHAELSLVLENLVIPTLVAGCAKLAPVTSVIPDRDLAAPMPITSADVTALTQLCIREDAQHLLEFVDRFLRSGNSVETIYIELLAPTARQLGTYWEEDSSDFVSVTMGLWRIQEVLRELTRRAPPVHRPGAGRRSALFSSMPGEQHSFGTLMVAECFERAGWLTDVLIEPTQSELMAKFAKHYYDVVGLTITCDCTSATLAGLVTTIRVVSCNSDVKVLIGGRTVNAQPSLVEQCGADGTAADAVAAVTLADRLVPVRCDSLEMLI